MSASDPKKREGHLAHRSNRKSGKRGRSGNESPAFPGSSLAGVPFLPLYHYPSSEPFPVFLTDDFPSEPYRTRHGEIKSSIHWGQRKLMLSEMQLLTMCCEPGVSYHIVYVGSAPGTHLGFLDDMFESRHTWELIDPGRFDRAVLKNRPNISLRNEFFTNYGAYEINVRRLAALFPALASVYRSITLDAMTSRENKIHERLRCGLGTVDVARGTEDIPSMYEPPLRLPYGLDVLTRVGMERDKPLLFISDIRSGSLHLPNFEYHVAENMSAQEAWTIILQAHYSMLKFRLPYTSKAKTFGGRDVEVETKLIRPDGTVPYLRGDILLPIWTRPTSTEARLLVPQGAFQKDYKVSLIEDQLFFFNTRVREQVHFNHFLPPTSDLDHHYDAAAEVRCLKKYLQFVFPKLKDAAEDVLCVEVERVSRLITKHLGTTFRKSILRRDALLISQAQTNYTNAAGSIPTPTGSADAVATSENGLGDRPVKDLKKDGMGSALASSTDKAFTALGESGNANNCAMSNWEVSTRRLIYLAERERKRVIWKINIDESKYNEPSGLWVTVSIGMG